MLVKLEIKRNVEYQTVKFVHFIFLFIVQENINVSRKYTSVQAAIVVNLLETCGQM